MSLEKSEQSIGKQLPSSSAVAKLLSESLMPGTLKIIRAAAVLADAKGIMSSSILGSVSLITLSGDKPEDKAKLADADPMQPLKKDEVDRATKVQDALIKLLPDHLLVNREPGQTAEQAGKAAQQRVKKLVTQLKEEREGQILGPATKKALTELQETLRQSDPRAFSGRVLTAEQVLTEKGFEKFSTLLDRIKRWRSAKIESELNKPPSGKVIEEFLILHKDPYLRNDGTYGRWTDYCCDSAMKGDKDSPKAIGALLHLVMNQGKPLERDAGRGHYLSLEAAAALVDLSWWTSGKEQAMIGYCIVRGLLDTRLSADVKLTLLKGWRHMVKNGLVSQGLAANTIGDVLQLECEKPISKPSGDSAEQQKLRKELLREHMLSGTQLDRRPILEATVDHDPSPDVRAFAKEALFELRDGIDRVWKPIAPSSAPIALRLLRIDRALDARGKSQEVAKTPLQKERSRDALVESIISNFKGYEFVDPRELPDDSKEKRLENKTIRESNSQALKLLDSALDDSNGKVRGVAAKVILESSIPCANPTKRKAIQTCFDLGVKSDNLQFRRDELGQLAKLKLAEAIEFKTSDGRVLRIAPEEKGISIVELTAGRVTGVLYPDGQSVLFQHDGSLVSEEAWNGRAYVYKRLKDSAGEFIDKWSVNGNSGEVWVGTSDVDSKGVYKYFKVETCEHKTIKPSGETETEKREGVVKLENRTEYHKFPDERSFTYQYGLLKEIVYDHGSKVTRRTFECRGEGKDAKFSKMSYYFYSLVDDVKIETKIDVELEFDADGKPTGRATVSSPYKKQVFTDTGFSVDARSKNFYYSGKGGYYQMHEFKSGHYEEGFELDNNG